MAKVDSGSSGLGASRPIAPSRSAAQAGGFSASGGRGGSGNGGRTAIGGSSGRGGGRIDVTKPNEWSTPGFVDGYERYRAAGMSAEELRVLRNAERDKIMAAMRRFAESRK